MRRQLIKEECDIFFTGPFKVLHVFNINLHETTDESILNIFPKLKIEIIDSITYLGCFIIECNNTYYLFCCRFSSNKLFYKPWVDISRHPHHYFFVQIGFSDYNNKSFIHGFTCKYIYEISEEEFATILLIDL